MPSCISGMGGGSGGSSAKSYTEVQGEYFARATPGQGSLTHDEGCTEKDYGDELRFAEWLYQTLGGDIHVKEEKHEYEGQKNPDFLWNGKLWDLKTISSEKAANDAIRRGQKQIKTNPGGVMLDLRDTSYSMTELIRIVNNRMKWYNDYAGDILIVSNGKIQKILRYKK